jgi:hypothetical protein
MWRRKKRLKLSRDILGHIEIANPPTSELPIKDDLDQARRVWKKGRMEWMGGPVYFEQGNKYSYKKFDPMTGQMEEEELINNDRDCKYAYPMGLKTDPMAHDLGVDTTEQ